MALRAKAEWYLKQKFASSSLERELGEPGPDCPGKTFVEWNCCNLHRALDTLHQAVADLGDELDADFHLGGVTNAYRMVLYAGKDTSDFHPNPRAPQVGSQAWLEQLSKASGVPLPENKPWWWTN